MMNSHTLRRNDLAGRIIVQTAEKNPRRKGTLGYRSFEIVKKASGQIKYEDYLAQGGRMQDLKWDIDHGYLKLAPKGQKINTPFLLNK